MITLPTAFRPACPPLRSLPRPVPIAPRMLPGEKRHSCEIKPSPAWPSFAISWSCPPRLRVPAGRAAPLPRVVLANKFAARAPGGAAPSSPPRRSAQHEFCNQSARAPTTCNTLPGPRPRGAWRTGEATAGPRTTSPHLGTVPLGSAPAERGTKTPSFARPARGPQRPVSSPGDGPMSPPTRSSALWMLCISGRPASRCTEASTALHRRLAHPLHWSSPTCRMRLVRQERLAERPVIV